MLVITGATGNIGSRLANNLIEQGHNTRVIGRSAERLKWLTDKGAQAAIGSLDDAGFLAEAFSGATGVFTMIPPNLQSEDIRAFQNRVGKATAFGIESAGVKQVVNLSSLGAHLGDRAGIVAGLWDQEERLNKLTGVNVVHLRPGWFMENTLAAVEAVKQHRVFGSPLSLDLKIAFVATADIADVATEYLSKLEFSGHIVRDIMGERDVTYPELAAAFSKAIGQGDIPYVQMSFGDFEGALTQMGMSDSYMTALIEYLKRLEDKAVVNLPADRKPESTTKTSIEDFAKIFAQLYKS